MLSGRLLIQLLNIEQWVAGTNVLAVIPVVCV